MNVDPITSQIINQATAMAQVRTSSEVSTAVFKKALDAKEQMALSLIASIPGAAPNTAASGQIIDVVA